MIGEERFGRLRAAFDEILDLPVPERQEAIRRASGADSSFAADLSGLLAAAERSTTPLDAPPLRPASKPESSLPESAPAGELESIPGYRLIEPIGRGGSSTVYLAEQLGDGFTRPVALKILHAWVDAALLRRFRAEQRILAALEHPGIARLYDAGIAPSGRPYLAMERVRGVTLVEHCERIRAPIPERIALFQKVLQAVEHAHAASIVHLDLKPGNILVAAGGEKGGRGEPKLLDFGIARLLRSEAEGEADVTETRHRGMTPAYASPEQVGGEPVGRLSDIYSLGVVLYELLTGRRPYKLVGTSLQTLERAIREEEPEPPGLGGDLDAILARAPRKEPEQRYPSAADFAADPSRHLEGRPVLARRGSLLYRVGKEVRRRRGLWGNVALATALLLGLSAWLSGGLRREAPEPADPNRSPWLAMPVAAAARSAFSQGLEALSRYDTTEAIAKLSEAAGQDPEQPLVQAALATAHGRAGHDALARAAGQQALGLAANAANAPRESRLLIEAVDLRTSGRRDESGKVQRSLWALQPGNFEVGLLLAVSLVESGAPEEALEVAARLRALPAGKKPEADVRIGLVELEALHLAGRPQEVVGKARAIVDRAKALGWPSLEGRALLQASQAYDALGDADETRALAGRARQLLAPRGELGEVARSLSLLCLASFRQSRHDEVERVCGESLRLHRKVGSATGAARALGILGVSRERRGLLAEARATFTQALAIEDHNFFGDRLGRARHLHNLANVESEMGHLLAAAESFRHAIAIQREAGTELSLVRGLCALAAVLSRRGLLGEAEAALQEAEPLARKSASARVLGEFLWQMGDLAKVEGEKAKANAWYDQAEGQFATMKEPGQMARFLANRKQLAEPSPRACRDLESSVRELERLGDRAATELAVGISRCWSEAGSQIEAKRWFGLAAKVATSSQLPEDRLELELARAAIALGERRWEEAEAILTTTAARCREASLGTLLMETRLLEARLARARGDHPERVRTLAEELRRDALAGRFGAIAAQADAILKNRGAA